MWHSLSVEEILSKLHTNFDGLSEKEVERRKKIYGENIIKFKQKNIILEVLKDEIRSPLIQLLIFAAFLSFYIGELNEGFLIIAVIFLYIFFNIFQQFRSEKIISLLKKESIGETVVKREGKLKKVKITDLVPGDIVILKQGDKVPADVRIIKCRNLYVDESILTGESKPVKKEETVLDKDTPLYERRNMLFMGTFVIRGYAEGIVVSTGNRTEIGKIYKMVEKIAHKKTPLKQEIDKFGKLITIITIIIILIVFTLSRVFRIFSLYDAIIFAIALGVAVIPEGLPTILTIIYTIGLYKIYKAKALVKELESVETLGSVDVIFTDKTGTLTVNQLTVRKFWFNNKIYNVTGSGYDPTGEIICKEENVPIDEIFIFIEACLNSNTSELVYENGWKVIGDPLEGALICLSYKAGLKSKLDVINVFDFDRERKRMSVVVKKGSKLIAFVKGAPEKILEISKHIYLEDRIVEIEEYKKQINEIIDKFAKEGYRLIALGYKELKNIREAYELDKVEKDIVFLGIVAMEDPIREEVKEAIEFARKASIDVIIITGDHPETAKIVARKIGIDGKYILSKDLEKMSNKSIVETLRKDIKIVARATPLDKYRILKAFKDEKYSVAMTGDGVNDAAALKLADIGISLSDATDVAREAADMILMDNSFKSIIEAIKEGRKILYNLKAFLLIILSINIALLSNILLSFFILKEIVLKAVHLLIINIGLEAVNAIIIGTNPVKKEFLLKVPERKFINLRFALEIIQHGLILGILSFCLIYFGIKSPFSIILYFALSQYALFYYYQNKFGILFTKNKWFYLSIVISLSIILLFSTVFSKYTMLYIPKVNEILKTISIVILLYIIYLFQIFLMYLYKKLLKYLNFNK